jgi:flagellar biogenesis protein FliO
MLAVPVAVGAEPSEATSRTIAGDDPGSRSLRTGTDDEVPPPGDGDGVWPWVRTLLALAAVVGLVLLARWLFRGAAGRAALPGRRPGKRQDPLQVVARRGLSSRHQLFLVRLGERLVLVGAGPQGLATLSEVTDPAERDRLLEALGAAPRAENSTKDAKQETAA